MTLDRQVDMQNVRSGGVPAHPLKARRVPMNEAHEQQRGQGRRQRNFHHRLSHGAVLVLHRREHRVRGLLDKEKHEQREKRRRGSLHQWPSLPSQAEAEVEASDIGEDEEQETAAENAAEFLRARRLGPVAAVGRLDKPSGIRGATLDHHTPGGQRRVGEDHSGAEICELFRWGGDALPEDEREPCGQIHRQIPARGGCMELADEVRRRIRQRLPHGDV
mmetsp:Transcript_117647/g.337478  ORF Transcript_117647/g.337478 Transcript_117647/m.337478 type:complete len:219 (-) Transcript_117647:205-861(-)